MIKHFKKILLVATFLLSTATHAQVKIIPETRNLLVPEVDSLEKFMKSNNIDYALLTYSTSNWIALDYIFYAMVRKKRSYYLMRLANLDVYAKKPILKINQKKLKKIQAQEYLRKIGSNEAFKFSNQEYQKLPTRCTVIKGNDTITYTGIYDNNTLNIFKHTKTSKSHINYYDPSCYLERCYPYNPEFGILKGFVNTYDKLTELVRKAFKDDVILPIQKRPRND